MTPQQATTSLQQQLRQLLKVGGELIEKRKAYMLAEAKYIDAENSARKQYFDSKPCKISELRDWIRLKSAFEYAKERCVHSEVKNIQIRYDMILETINVLKISIKLMQDEMKNLNNQI